MFKNLATTVAIKLIETQNAMEDAITEKKEIRAAKRQDRELKAEAKREHLANLIAQQKAKSA